MQAVFTCALTCCCILWPPRMSVVSAGGVLEVNADNDPELFSMAKVGLGCLGVVTELTLKVRLLLSLWWLG